MQLCKIIDRDSSSRAPTVDRLHPCGAAAPAPVSASLAGCYARGGGEPLSEFEKERERLSKLPRAQRFEELIDFPTRHVFKVIGPREGLSLAVRKTLSSLGFNHHVTLVERYSSSGKHCSLTFELEVASGAKLDAIYTALERMEGVSYLF